MHCDDLPPGLAFILFDSAVNSGVPAASKWLQGTLVRWGQDVKIDGVIGPVTVAAAKRVSGLADAFLATRAEALMGFVKEDPTQQKWLHGWLTREFRVGREAGVL
jgi:lysozyme family protein